MPSSVHVCTCDVECSVRPARETLPIRVGILRRASRVLERECGKSDGTFLLKFPLLNKADQQSDDRMRTMRTSSRPRRALASREALRTSDL